MRRKCGGERKLKKIIALLAVAGERRECWKFFDLDVNEFGQKRTGGKPIIFVIQPNFKVMFKGRGEILRAQRMNTP